MSVVRGNMLRLQQSELLGLEGIEGLEDNVGIHGWVGGLISCLDLLSNIEGI